MKLKLYTIALAFFATTFAVNVHAQSCTGETVKFKETFGTGNSAASLSSTQTSYTYSTSDLADGEYRLSKTTQGRPEWFNSTDHTGDSKGRMMVINASYAAGEFYRDTIQNLTANAFYTVYLYAMNVNTMGTCSPNPLLPKLQFIIDVSTNGGSSFTQLISFTSAYLPQTATATWVKVGGNFALPANVNTVRYRVINNSTGGCGNDVAIDDITFSQCTAVSGIGSLPVTGLALTASQKGSDAQLDWTTLAEINSDHFEIEKSVDGVNWNTIATAKAAGNSAATSYYSYTDKNIASGNLFYRLKEVDIDGKFMYSSVVTMKAASAAGASVKVTAYPNPFVSSVGLELTDNNNETVFVRMMDQQGRIVKQQSWNVKKGYNSASLTDLQRLSPGIYFMSISNASGESIYTSKLIK
jgi:hypothetical protein